MKKNIYIIAFMLIFGCQNQNSSNNNSANQEESESIEVADSKNNESISDIDLSTLKGNSYLSLFKLYSNSEAILVEPACLSECPSISFDLLDNDMIQFACGQDAIRHKVTKATDENDTLTFLFENNLKLEVVEKDSTTKNPFEHIVITLSNFEALYMGYYEDSITSVNSDRLIMMLNNQKNRDLLKSLDRWAAIPCPDDVFD